MTKTEKRNFMNFEKMKNDETAKVIYLREEKRRKSEKFVRKKIRAIFKLQFHTLAENDAKN